MSRKSMTYAGTILIVVLWSVLLFAQHLVCFDFFDSNLWYLYLLAMLFAGIQFLLLTVVCGKSLQICSIVYAILAALKLMQFITALSNNISSWGLALLCIGLDICGAAYAGYLVHKIKHAC